MKAILSLFLGFFFLTGIAASENATTTPAQVPPAPAESTYDSKGKRDPFIPLIGEDGSEQAEGSDNVGGFRVEGIIFDPGRESLAVINGKVVKEGEAIGPYKVAKIEKTSVVLNKQDETFTLRLKASK